MCSGMNKIRYIPIWDANNLRDLTSAALMGIGTPWYAIIDCTAIIDAMASITIRNLEADTKRKLRIRAAMKGRSMEQEAREILKSALALTSKRKANLAERIREIFGPLGGVELERLPRELIPDPDWLAERE